MSLASGKTWNGDDLVARRHVRAVRFFQTRILLSRCYIHRETINHFDSVRAEPTSRNPARDRFSNILRILEAEALESHSIAFCEALDITPISGKCTLKSSGIDTFEPMLLDFLILKPRIFSLRSVIIDAKKAHSSPFPSFSFSKFNSGILKRNLMTRAACSYILLRA